jgi:hypothetical protein
MEAPTDVSRPFFAYGVFKPGQLAYFQIRDLVQEAGMPFAVTGQLLLRDGLPIIDPDGSDAVDGVLLTFRDDCGAEAYRRISQMEPDLHYRWHVMDERQVKANVLVGRSPRKGSKPFEGEEWNGWEDPLFTAALEVVEETLANDDFDWNLKPLFRLQMAYLLLWSSIERYVSLRYHLGDKVAQKVLELAQEPAFAAALPRYVHERREVFRADRPSEKYVLDPYHPSKTLHYYYQVRSNITHRGKGNVWDHERVRSSLQELLAIFREVLAAARQDATAPVPAS